MAKVNLTAGLKTEYADLFNTCRIRENNLQEVEQTISGIESNRGRYEQVADSLNIPWYFIAVIHSMESSSNFSRHLHNGDPLSGRTVQVPSGRPKTGHPPFTWEESATDALKLRNLHKWNDWTRGALLYQLEGYNGWGYRLYHSHVLSPYLWSYSNHYVSGKYVADGTWSDVAVSKQCGAAVLLRRMLELGKIVFEEEPTITAEPDKPVVYFSDDSKIEYGEELQKFLNRFPGVYLKEDGWPGEKTSDAFKKITGYYLIGDPRIL